MQFLWEHAVPSTVRCAHPVREPGRRGRADGMPASSLLRGVVARVVVGWEGCGLRSAGPVVPLSDRNHKCSILATLAQTHLASLSPQAFVFAAAAWSIFPSEVGMIWGAHFQRSLLRSHVTRDAFPDHGMVWKINNQPMVTVFPLPCLTFLHAFITPWHLFILPVLFILLVFLPR